MKEGTTSSGGSTPTVVTGSPPQSPPTQKPWEEPTMGVGPGGQPAPHPRWAAPVLLGTRL